jgi:hypothetical protein
MKWILAIAVFLSIMACNQVNQNVESQPLSTQQQLKVEEALKTVSSFSWIDSTYNFGKIKEGEKVSFRFSFKNTHPTNYLVVKNVEAGCGCTVPNKPAYAIAPGGTDYITVQFNSRGKASGGEETPINQTVTVFCNTVSETFGATFTGIVLKN